MQECRLRSRAAAAPQTQSSHSSAIRLSQRRTRWGSTWGWFAYASPAASFSFLKGRGAAEAEHQLLCEDLLFASSGSSAYSQMEILHGLYMVRLLGACCGLTPGHKGQFSTTA